MSRLGGSEYESQKYVNVVVPTCMLLEIQELHNVLFLDGPPWGTDVPGPCTLLVLPGLVFAGQFFYGWPRAA